MGAGPREQSSPSLAHPSSAYKLQAQVWEALLLSTKASRMVMILGYWDIRGVSEGAAALGGMEAHGVKNAAPWGPFVLEGPLQGCLQLSPF